MNRFLFSLVAALLISSNLYAQNPLISGQFTADPTARVFGDKVYVYPSHDIPPVEALKGWFCMADYHVFSSSDLTHWQDHGIILSQEQVPWGNHEGYSMWAPDCVKGSDGRYYFYFPCGLKPEKPGARAGFGVGVAIGDRPEGPFVAQEKNIEGIMGIDPCVMQTTQGEQYIFWAGGVIRGARLTPDGLALASEPQIMEGLPDGFKEGPFAFQHNGHYYLTFPWVRTEGGTETLAYAMSDQPLGPWKFQGVIMEESPTGCWTNHHSIVEYKGQWYLFYHHNDYSPRFDKNRSMRCDSLSFNSDGTIKPVRPTYRGVGITDASELVQIDCGDLMGGATRALRDTLHPFEGWQVTLPSGASVSYGNVRIPTGDYRTWVCTAGFWGRTQVQQIEQTSLKLDVLPQDNGLHTLVLSNTGQTPVQVDWVSLNARQPLSPLTQGGLVTGQYRNLFLEAGYSQAQIDQKVDEVFNDVFFGPNKVYFEVGDDMGYISDVKNNDVRTEGMSYGMMIAVQFGRKDIFDRLWRWCKKYMQMTDGPMQGYFRWSCKTDGTPNAQGPASDGELYYITSLLFASNLWGNETGINYLGEAQYILDVIQPKTIEVKINRDRQGNLLKEPITMSREVSLIDTATNLITFVPGVPYTDPSYHLPAFYEVWARYAQDGRSSYWQECARASREYLHRSIDGATGLNPDYNNFDGSLLRNGHLIGDAFRYDSWRVPMNIALDYSWSCADRVWQQNYGHLIQNFLYSQGLDTFVDQYNVDGTRPDRLLRAGNYPEALRHSIGLVATSAAVSLVCTHAKAYEFVDAFWNARHEPDESGYFDAYYDGLLRLFAFMHLSGRYRVIERTMQFSQYFAPATETGISPDEQGFLHRWKLAEPLSRPNASNTLFTDTYLRDMLQWDPKQQLTWHHLDSKHYNVKLFRFATCQELPYYGVLFWVETVIDCPEEIQDVRLSVGSNSASRWWLDGEEVLMLSGDRRMVQDDAMSHRLTLHKGRNVLRGAIINGPGMSDFCVRFIDESGSPVLNYSIR